MNSLPFFGCFGRMSNGFIPCTQLDRFETLREADVARVLGMIARTHTGLPNNTPLHCPDFSGSGDGHNWASPSTTMWNIDVFVDVLKEKVLASTQL